MKNSICLFAVILWQSLFMFSFADSTTPPIVIVHLYAENLKMWNETKNTGQYSEAIKDLCSSSFRVNDDIMSDYAERTGMPKLIHYDYNDYEKCWHNIIKKGATIQIKNIRIDNSVEFNAVNYGHSGPVTFVSAEVDVEGALNYHVKEIFRIKQGKITHILDYDGDKALTKAFGLCIENRFREAYDVFEGIVFNSNNHGYQSIANKFAISLLLNKHRKLDMDEYVYKYKLARNLYRHNGIIYRKQINLPKLNIETYGTYMYYEEQGTDENNIYHYNPLIKLPESWEKDFPYATAHGNDWTTQYSGQLYVVFIGRYRKAEKSRFPKVFQELYGFVDAKGKEIIPAQYKFAYPFDEDAGLALVQHRNGKWGYIDMQGNPITLQNYDVASDVFVDGKTNVIRDGYLILIDKDGHEIKSTYGYRDLSHKQDDDKMLAIRAERGYVYDLIDFKGNIIKAQFGRDEEKGKTSIYESVRGCSLGMNFK